MSELDFTPWDMTDCLSIQAPILIPRKGCNSDLLPNSFSGILGYCRLQAGGSTILMRLDIKLYAGLLSRESIGVFG